MGLSFRFSALKRGDQLFCNVTQGSGSCDASLDSGYAQVTLRCYWSCRVAGDCDVSLYGDDNCDHHMRGVSSMFLSCKVTVFHFVINNQLAGKGSKGRGMSCVSCGMLVALGLNQVTVIAR